MVLKNFPPPPEGGVGIQYWSGILLWRHGVVLQTALNDLPFTSPERYTLPRFTISSPPSWAALWTLTWQPFGSLQILERTDLFVGPQLCNCRNCCVLNHAHCLVSWKNTNVSGNWICPNLKLPLMCLSASRKSLHLSVSVVSSLMLLIVIRLP
jgi:hypothetical protein